MSGEMTEMKANRCGYAMLIAAMATSHTAQSTEVTSIVYGRAISLTEYPIE